MLKAGVKYQWIFVVLIFLVFISQELNAQPIANNNGVFIIGDFDSTMVAGQEGRSSMTRGSWNGPVVLRRVFFRGQIYQPVATGPEELIVSQKDYYELFVYHDRLARGEMDPGIAVGQKYTVMDMQTGKRRTIRPSEYMLAPDWFRFYRADPTGQRNYLLEQFEAAKSGKWQGTMYPLFAAALSTPEAASALTIESARYYPETQWDQLFDAFAKHTANDELPIRHRPGAYVSTSGPETEHFSNNPRSATESKPGWQEEFIRIIIKMDPENAPMRLSPNGDVMKKSYFIIFADDNPNTIERVHSLFKKYATDTYGRYVKFGIYNALSNAEVARTGRPRFSIYMNSGLVRPATEEERVGETLAGDVKVIEAAKKVFAKMEKAFKPKLKKEVKVETVSERPTGLSCRKSLSGGGQ
ncbi:MAG: hypothetical protein AB7F59_11475 [Bdellovibrionales bacterium]